MKPKNKKRKDQYRSGLERTFATNVEGCGFEFEPASLPYTMHRKYLPDFVKGDVLIECKGFFRAGDTLKYKSVRDSYPQQELIFVLSDPYKKVRKGSKLCMGQWCFKEGFAFFTVNQWRELKGYMVLTDAGKQQYRNEHLRGG
jgi:hypothetical protein|tara:strand:- start:2218 stop:2646 length:429 start_codon:yes stop_codon:yes gene_type:complete